MSKDRNVCTFTGRLTRDPSVKNVGESTVANFAIAVNNSWMGKDGERREEVTFVELDSWNGTAKFVSEYCKKGDFVLVDAEYRQNVVEKDDERRTYHSFRVNNLQKLSWDKKEESAAPAKEESKKRGRKPKQQEEESEEDSLPF